jgi:hypothetical protein
VSALQVAPHDRYISIERFSPFHLPDARRRYVVMHSFADGANKSHEKGHITLACLSAPEGIWPSFERDWGAVLAKYKMKWWHTTDAMSHEGKRDFLIDEADHWDNARARVVSEVLEKVIYDSLTASWERGFQVATCTVNLDDYRIARGRNWFLRSAEAICVHGCTGTLRLDDDGLGLLYFDHGEGFLNEIYQVWIKDRRKLRVGWTKQIEVITPLDAKISYPLQAADLMAWKITTQSRV